MNNNNEGIIVDPTKEEEVEYSQPTLDAIERLNLPHPDYEG